MHVHARTRVLANFECFRCCNNAKGFTSLTNLISYPSIYESILQSLYTFLSQQRPK